VASELFELKVIVEADGWHDIAELMDGVDRALDPHRRARGGTRLPTTEGAELLAAVDDDEEGDAAVATDRLSA
jgi:hypothetical protein